MINIYYNTENCINLPLVVGDIDSPIMEFVAVPELHLLLGIVQHLYNSLKKDNEEIAELWLKKAGVYLDYYQQFNGNNARKLLKSTDALISIDPGTFLFSNLKTFMNYFINLS